MTITPCIPTLHNGFGIIIDPADIVAYVIRHVFAQSSKTSIQYTDECLSFRDIEVRYGAIKEEMLSYLNNKLNTILGRYFTSGSVGVSVTSTTPDADGLYNLEITATANPGTSNEKLILTEATISIQNGNVLNIVFKGAKI